MPHVRHLFVLLPFVMLCERHMHLEPIYIGYYAGHSN